MHCTCGRPHFTPRRWNSVDNRTTFIMDIHGFTDMVPGPRSRLIQWLETNYPAAADLGKTYNPYNESSNHIHWAMKSDD